MLDFAASFALLKLHLRLQLVKLGRGDHAPGDLVICRLEIIDGRYVPVGEALTEHGCLSAKLAHHFTNLLLALTKRALAF